MKIYYAIYRSLIGCWKEEEWIKAPPRSILLSLGAGREQIVSRQGRAAQKVRGGGESWPICKFALRPNLLFFPLKCLSPFFSLVGAIMKILFPVPTGGFRVEKEVLSHVMYGSSVVVVEQRRHLARVCRRLKEAENGEEGEVDKWIPCLVKKR